MTTLPLSGYLTGSALEEIGNEVVQKVGDALLTENGLHLEIFEWRVMNGEAPLDYTKQPVTNNMAENWAKTAYSGVVQAYMDFATTDPRELEPMISTLWGVAHALDPDLVDSVVASKGDQPIPTGTWSPDCSVSERVNKIEKNQLLPYWHGHAATAFQSDFLDVLADRAPAQSLVAMVLSNALVAQQQITLHTHADVRQIRDRTLDALDAIVHSHDGDPAMLLETSIALAGVLFAIPTDGGSIAAAAAGDAAVSTALDAGGQAFAVASSVKSAASAVHSAATHQYATVNGKTVDSVVSSMFRAMHKLKRVREQQERQIVRYLNTVSEQLVPGSLAAPEPTQVTKPAQTGLKALHKNFYPVA
jgi:hypothetical protein